jgi:hypothetical protein
MIGKRAIYTQSGEIVEIVKVRKGTIDRDLMGKKVKPYPFTLVTVRFNDGEEQTTDLTGIKLLGGNV